MVAFNVLSLDAGTLGELLRDADGNIRAALACWGIALGAFIVLRVPREVLLACLLAATLTVGFAALVMDAAPRPATASADTPPPSPVHYRAMSRGAPLDATTSAR